MKSAFASFIVADAGQDVVEYALLVSLVVLVSVAAWDAIATALGISYHGYDSGLWDLYGRPPGT